MGENSKHTKPFIETGKAYKSDLEVFSAHGIKLPKDTVAIANVFVPPEMRNTGIGSKLIEEFLAKNKNKAVILNVYPHESEGSLDNEEFGKRQEKLTQFYSKFGFKSISKNWMYKLPNTSRKNAMDNKQVEERLIKAAMQDGLANKIANSIKADGDETPMEELSEEMGIGPEAVPDEFEVETTIEELLSTMNMDDAEEFADKEMNMWRGVHHELNKRRGAADKKNNPWAICTESVGREDEAKYKRCKKDVEEKNK